MSKDILIEKLKKTKTKQIGVRLSVLILDELDLIINEVNENDEKIETDRSKMISVALEEFIKNFKKN